MKSILVIPDTHVPFHDRKAWGALLAVLRVKQPDHTVFLGDFVDCYTVSSFPKSPDRQADLKSEIDAANHELDKVEAVTGKRATFLEGNHCERLARYLNQKAPELFGLVDMQALLRIKARGWKWVPYRQHTYIGKLAFAHDIGHAGKGAVQQSLDAMGHNLLIGHTHRAGIVYGGTVKGEHRVAMSCGWLGDLSKIDYMHRAKTRDWQHGFGWVRQAPNGDSWVTFVPIINGRCCIEGETISYSEKRRAA